MRIPQLASVGLIAVLLCCGFIFPAAGLPADGIPQTQEEIHSYAQQILRDEILTYCAAVYAGENTPHMSADQLAIAIKNYPEYPRRITDTKNTTITIVQPIARMVAFNTQGIGALKAEDLVVGIANSTVEDTIVMPALKDKINVGGGGPYEPDFEKILSSRPDALLTYTRLGPGPEFFEKRMPAGVPVIRLDFIRPWTLVPEMEKLGYLLNRTTQSSAYVQWYDQWMTKIDQRLAAIPDKDRTRVFIDIWSSTYTNGNNERMTVSTMEYNYYCTDAGGINIASSLKNPQGTVDIEWIAQQKPDVILGIAYAGGYGSDDITPLKTQYDELMDNPALKEVPAIKNKRVYIVSYRYVNGLAYPSARARIASWFYPNQFADIDPAAIHQEYVTQFLGSSFDVTKHGAFWYAG